MLPWSKQQLFLYLKESSEDQDHFGDVVNIRYTPSRVTFKSQVPEEIAHKMPNLSQGILPTLLPFAPSEQLKKPPRRGVGHDSDPDEHIFQQA